MNGPPSRSYTNNFGFSFPFYGTNQSSGFVGTNGYITFGQGDSTYTESLPAFNTLPRISAFFDACDRASRASHDRTLTKIRYSIPTATNPIVPRHHPRSGAVAELLTTTGRQLVPQGGCACGHRGQLDSDHLATLIPDFVAPSARHPDFGGLPNFAQ